VRSANSSLTNYGYVARLDVNGPSLTPIWSHYTKAYTEGQATSIDVHATGEFLGNVNLSGGLNPVLTNGLVGTEAFVVRLDPALQYMKTAPNTPAFETEVSGLEALRIYPNPSNGRMQLELPEAEVATSVAIMDATGKIVWSRQIQAGQMTATLDLSGLSKGIYFARISQGADRAVKKWMIF